MGLFESAKALVANLVATAKERVELFSTEFQEEMARLVAVLIWSLAAVLFAVVGLTFVAVLILLTVDEAFRGLTAGILALTFILVGAASAAYARGLIRAKPRAFDASLSELERDREALKDDR